MSGVARITRPVVCLNSATEDAAEAIATKLYLNGYALRLRMGRCGKPRERAMALARLAAKYDNGLIAVPDLTDQAEIAVLYQRATRARVLLVRVRVGTKGPPGDMWVDHYHRAPYMLVAAATDSDARDEAVRRIAAWYEHTRSSQLVLL